MYMTRENLYKSCNTKFMQTSRDEHKSFFTSINIITRAVQNDYYSV